MKIVSDHGFPKGSLPDDDAFDRFKNERDYNAKSGRNETVAAMDWAAAEIERLRAISVTGEAREDEIRRTNAELAKEYNIDLATLPPVPEAPSEDAGRLALKDAE